MALALEPLPSAANTYGVEFELKMAALVALRAQQRPGTFQVFRNVKVALPMDDIVVRLSDGNTSSLLFLQLKHGDKQGKTIGLQAFAPQQQNSANKNQKGKTKDDGSKGKVLSSSESSSHPKAKQTNTASKGNFNLLKYFKFFEQLDAVHRKPENELTADESLLRQTPLDGVHFIIFTNKVVSEMKSNTQKSKRNQQNQIEEFLNTGEEASTFQFDQTTDLLWNLLGDDDRGKLYREQFLPRLRVFHEQAHVSQLDRLITEEIQKIVKKPLSEEKAKGVLHEILKDVEKWAEENTGECLWSESRLVERAVGAVLRKQALETGEDLQFDEGHREQLQEAVRGALLGPSPQRLQVSVEGVPAGVRAAKLLQVLEALQCKWTYVCDSTLKDFEHNVLKDVCGSCKVVVWDVTRPSNDVIERIQHGSNNGPCVVQLMNGTSINRSYKHFKDIWTLSHLNSDCQDRFINNIINFQGELITLKELEERWETMREDVDGRLLSALLRKETKFGRDIIALDDEMLPRRLTHFHKVSSRTLMDKSVPREVRLALQGFPKDILEEAARRLGFLASQQGANKDQILRENPRWTVICYEGEPCPQISRQYLKSLVQGKAVQEIHWVEYISGESVDNMCMIWRESFGSYDSMKKLVEPISEESCSSNTPICVHESNDAFEGLKRALLVGEAGNGKTSYISSLASQTKQNDPLAWIVPVKILDHRELLRRWNKLKNLTKDHVLELVATAVRAENGAARRCLEAAFRHKDVTVLVDGVDEVAPAFMDLTLRILHLLDDMCVRRLWITSRPEVEASLRHMTRSPPLALQPFDLEEQERLLTFCLASERSEQETRSIATWANQMLGGNPLHLRMVMEIVNIQHDIFDQATISLYELYEHFSTAKYEQYKEKYSLISQLQYHFDEIHEKCAIVYLFADDENELPIEEFAEYVRSDISLSQTEEKTGIVWKVGNTLSFTHQTFAEFFAARWLFRNAGSCQAVRNFVLKLMGRIRNESRVVRFVQEQLAKDWPLHAAACCHDMHEVQRLTEGDFREHWDRKDTWLEWTFGEYVSWAYKDSIVLHTEEETFNGYWLISLMRAAAVSGCPSVVAEVMRRADLPHSTLQCALRAAVEFGENSSGQIEVARLLLEKGVEEDPECEDTLLHMAANRGSASMVDLLLKYAQDVNAWNLLSLTPLHMALGDVVYHNHEASQRLIEEESVDVNAEDKEGNSPLCYASCADCVSCAESLLLRGAKVDGGGVPPLCKATVRNNTTSMRFLMQKGASVNATDRDGWSPLHYSAIGQGMEAVHLLLSEGADIHLKNKGGESALDVAADEHIAIVLKNFTKCTTIFDKKKQLEHLDLIVNLLAAAQRGSQEEVLGVLEHSTFSALDLKRALLVASKGESRGHTEVTGILLQHGAKDVQTRAWREKTSLHYAADEGNTETLDLLLRHFHDVNPRDSFGQTPLHLAIGLEARDHSHQATQCLLKEESVDVDAEDIYGRTPLCLASAVDCVSCAELLLLRGAKVDGGRIPPLCSAAEENNTNLMRLLIQKGASVNATDEDDFSPLHHSVSSGGMEAVHLLLSEGTDVHLKDKEGRTALDIAVEEKEEEIADVLENITASVKRISDIHS